MASVVDKYYRRIAQNIDNVRMKFDISALLVKSKEHDSKIENNKSNIAENLTLIEANKSNISENLKLINSKSDIIEDNKSNISNNYNITQVINKKAEYNLSLIDTHTSNISDINLSLTDINSDILSNLSKINELIELLNNKIPQKIFEKTYNIINKKFNSNKTTHFFEILNIDIEYNFKKNSSLHFNSNIYYKYKDLENDIDRLCHQYDVYSKEGLVNILVYNNNIFHHLTLQRIFYM